MGKSDSKVIQGGRKAPVKSEDGESEEERNEGEDSEEDRHRLKM